MRILVSILQFEINLECIQYHKYVFRELFESKKCLCYEIQYDIKLHAKWVTGVNWINLSVISI